MFPIPVYPVVLSRRGFVILYPWLQRQIQLAFRQLSSLAKHFVLLYHTVTAVETVWCVIVLLAYLSASCVSSRRSLS